MRRSLLLAPLALVVIASCGSDDDDAASTEPPASSESPTPSGPPASTPTVGSLRPSELTIAAPSPPPLPSVVPPGGPTGSAEEAAAVADLAARQGADPAAITVVSVEDVTWRSGAIGCPDPAMIYTQALVPGTRIVLELDGTRYQYHSGGARSIFLCERPEPPVGG